MTMKKNQYNHQEDSVCPEEERISLFG